MLFKIIHLTEYNYSGDVFLNPHILRFKPRTDACQQVRSHEWSIQPLPAGKSPKMGLDNNQEWTVWFEGQTRRLNIQAVSVVETFSVNPFNFLLYPFTATRLPITYIEEVQQQLQPYLLPLSTHASVEKFAKETMLETDYQTLQFVTYLTQKIYKTIKNERRETGVPLPPEQTLASGKGSCRDITYLQMAICRRVGIASRFVSGYLYNRFGTAQHDLHAWVEVYLPGGGWKGFDPTTGLAVTEYHIAVASSAFPGLCAPVKGSFHGDASATLFTQVSIEVM